jgi:hypothetical protein
MSHSGNTHLVDFSDELLLAIFNKVKPTDMLWSIIDVNKRLDKTSGHRHFITQMIDLTATSILDRFCSHILPRILHDAIWLVIQTGDIHCVLLSAKYPNLIWLTFLHLRQKEIDKYCLGTSS